MAASHVRGLDKRTEVLISRGAFMGWPKLGSSIERSGNKLLRYISWYQEIKRKIEHGLMTWGWPSFSNVKILLGHNDCTRHI